MQIHTESVEQKQCLQNEPKDFWGIRLPCEEYSLGADEETK